MPESHQQPDPGSRPPAIEVRLREAGLPGLPRLAWLEVELEALAANARLLASLQPGGRLACVVKADGYGHGIEAAAHAALAGGAAMLAVATLDEALALRAAGFEARILVLYALPPGAVPDALAAGLDLSVMDAASAAAITGALRRRAAGGVTDPPDAGPRVHVGIDTGMTRGGVAPGEAASVARALRDAGLGRIAGTWSHLASPEQDDATGRQVAAFEAALGNLAAFGIDPGLRHLDATGGLLARSGPRYDLARVGLALYGEVPPEVRAVTTHGDLVAGLRPALSLRARAVSLQTVDPGTPVGYGGEWLAQRRSVVATLPVGYADGWVRAYGPGSQALVRGRLAPIVGRVSSDAVAVDVTDLDGLDGLDELVLLGPPDEGGSNVADLARRRGSIAWEVLDALTVRLPRVYTSAGRVVALRLPGGSLATRTGFVLQTRPHAEGDRESRHGA